MYRNLLLVGHLAAVAAWLGCNFTQFFLTPWFAKRGGEAAATWFEATSQLARRFYNVAGVVLVVTGILLVRSFGYRWSAGFVAVGITVVVIGAVVGITYFAPHGDRMAVRSRAGEPVDSGRYLLVAGVDTVLVLTAMLAMVSQWRA